jgi:hypothetical protein
MVDIVNKFLKTIFDALYLLCIQIVLDKIYFNFNFINLLVVPNSDFSGDYGAENIDFPL